MANVPLIEIRNATIYRGDTRVFDELSLTIEQGQPTAILGPNGSGKTTLLRVINRELYPVHSDASVVRILGKETWNVWELREHIGIVSHDLHARYPDSTTGLGVVLSGYLASIGVHGSLANRASNEQKSRALRIMDELGVKSFANTPLRKMSTGQQRRCLLARALVHDPHTLILDEPTAGLDLAAGFDYIGRIRKIAAAGKSIVLVTHLLNEIPPDIVRVVLLRKGKIIADGAKHEVLTEHNLRRTYDTEINVAKVGGYYVAFPPSP